MSRFCFLDFNVSCYEQVFGMVRGLDRLMALLSTTCFGIMPHLRLGSLPRMLDGDCHKLTRLLLIIEVKFVFERLCEFE